MVLHLYTALCIISLCFLRAVHSESWDTELTNIDARRVPIDFLRVCIVVIVSYWMCCVVISVLCSNVCMYVCMYCSIV